MTRTMTDNDRDGMDVARDEFEHNERIMAVCEMAAEILRPLMIARSVEPALKPLLDREFARYRESLELMTGETWPTQLPAFLAKCDEIVRGDEDVAA